MLLPPHPLTYQQVLRLDVSVDDVLGVAVAQRTRQRQHIPAEGQQKLCETQPATDVNLLHLRLIDSLHRVHRWSPTGQATANGSRAGLGQSQGRSQAHCRRPTTSLPHDVVATHARNAAVVANCLRCCPALVKVSQLLQLLVQLPLGCVLQDEVHLLLQDVSTV